MYTFQWFTPKGGSSELTHQDGRTLQQWIEAGFKSKPTSVVNPAVIRSASSCKDASRKSSSRFRYERRYGHLWCDDLSDQLVQGAARYELPLEIVR